MIDRTRAGDQQDIGRALQQPGERDLHWCCVQIFRHALQRVRLQGIEPAEREERDIGDPLTREVIDQIVIAAIRPFVLAPPRAVSNSTGEL